MTSVTPQADQLNHRSSSAAAETPKRIRVLLADDHPAVRVGMRRLIEDQPDMAVVREARSAEEALGDGEPSEDVVVLDYHLGGRRDGLWVTRQLKHRPRPPRVLIYSAFADSPLAAAALVAGADGLLSKTSLGEELCHAIRALARGRHYLPAVPQTVAQALLSQLRPDDRAIFRMLLADVEAEEITERLGMSAGQLDDRRGSMLLALAPASHHAGESHAPLDYERPRRHARYRGPVAPPPTPERRAHPDNTRGTLRSSPPREHRRATAEPPSDRDGDPDSPSARSGPESFQVELDEDPRAVLQFEREVAGGVRIGAGVTRRGRSPSVQASSQTGHDGAAAVAAART